MKANYVHKDSTSLVQENKELKIELSGYRQAILEDKDMLGLKEENQELKQKYLNAVSDYETTMFEKEQLNSLVNSCQEEIRQLKKQLEEYQLQNIDLRADIMIQKKAFPNKLIKDKTFYDLYDMPTYEDLLNQQKEFINYINTYIELLKDKPDLVEEGQKDVLEEILQKYKSIIGDVKNENK